MKTTPSLDRQVDQATFELVEAEPGPVHTSREQAILRRIEAVLERTKT